MLCNKKSVRKLVIKLINIKKCSPSLTNKNPKCQCPLGKECQEHT